MRLVRKSNTYQAQKLVNPKLTEVIAVATRHVHSTVFSGVFTTTAFDSTLGIGVSEDGVVVGVDIDVDVLYLTDIAGSGRCLEADVLAEVARTTLCKLRG